MSALITGSTAGGTVWIPAFVKNLNQGCLHRLRGLLQGVPEKMFHPRGAATGRLTARGDHG